MAEQACSMVGSLVSRRSGDRLPRRSVVNSLRPEVMDRALALACSVSSRLLQVEVK